MRRPTVKALAIFVAVAALAALPRTVQADPITFNFGATGPAVLTTVRLRRPDAVLMEIGLPRMDGWKVARRLREERGRFRPLLLAVSGYGSERDRARSREAGFDGHLVKPVFPEAIRNWLVTSLAVRRIVQ